MQLPWLLIVSRVCDIQRYLLVQVGWKGSWAWQLRAQLHLWFTHREPWWQQEHSCIWLLHIWIM